MPTCFVIQPFDAKFDKRYMDVFKPAIEAAGLDAYRVDADPSVQVPIEAIEEGIRKADVCLAEITTDNPNVWYELGFAFASGRSVVMVCSEERTTKKYPFDIQHRTIISYSPESSSDFEKLKQNLTAKIAALLKKGENLQKISESSPLAPKSGLSQPEILVLAVMANAATMPDMPVAIWSLRRDAERAGVTSLGFNLGIRRLTAKQFIASNPVEDRQEEETYDGLLVTEQGWRWIESNESQFVVQRTPGPEPDEIPF